MTNLDASATAQTLDYASPTAPRPMSRVMARRVAWGSFLPGVAGLSLLALYRLTASDWVIPFGFVGAIIGGVTTSVLLCTAFVGFLQALIRRPPERMIALLYSLALVGTAITLVIAVTGALAASHWYLSPHEPLSVRNATPLPIDGVTMHFDNGDITAGPLQPGETKVLGRRWLIHRGALDISVRIGDHVRRKRDRSNTDLYYEKGPTKRKPVEIVVERAELPKATP